MKKEAPDRRSATGGLGYRNERGDRSIARHRFNDAEDSKGSNLDRDLGGDDLLAGEQVDQRRRVLVPRRIGNVVAMPPVVIIVGDAMMVSVSRRGVRVPDHRSTMKGVVPRLAANEESKHREQYSQETGQDPAAPVRLQSWEQVTQRAE